MQTKLLGRRKWTTVLELNTEIAEMQSYHDYKRRHSSLDLATSTRDENLHAPCSN